MSVIMAIMVWFVGACVTHLVIATLESRNGNDPEHEDYVVIVALLWFLLLPLLAMVYAAEWGVSSLNRLAKHITRYGEEK